MSEASPGAREDARRFHIHTCLGSGGFGDVYRAMMTSSGGVRHEVAVKVLHDGLDPGSQAVQRLRDEGRLLGVLRHPAILRVHDLCVLGGRVALVTEYVEGGDLDQCYKAGDLQLRPLLEVVAQVAAALDAAWNTVAPSGTPLHLVHRDVKPANIRIGRHGEVKLLDFGIAKAAGVRREAQTRARALIGSYLYMSPERLSRKEGYVPAGDIYALGAVLYEGLGRRRLFSGVELRDQLDLSMNSEAHTTYVRDAVNALHNVDPRARGLVLAALAFDERDRPSALDFSNACEELADALPGDNLRQWCRKRTWPEPRDRKGELGGRTLTETTLISDTHDPVPRRQDENRTATMVGFLDDNTTAVPTGADPSMPTVQRRGAAPTIVAFEDEPDEDSVPEPVDPRGVTVARHDSPAPERRPSNRAIWPILAVLSVGGLVAGSASLALVGWVLLGDSEPPSRVTPGLADIQPEAPEAPVALQGEEATDASSEPAPPKRAPEPRSRDRASGTTGAASPTPAPSEPTAPEGEAASESGSEQTTAPGADSTEGTGTEAGDGAPPPTVRVVKEPEAPRVVITPEPEPELEPEPEPDPPMATVAVDGRIPVQLRGAGQTHIPPNVPPGTWFIWADFGSGMVKASDRAIQVSDGQSWVVKCSALRQQCTFEGA